MTAGPRAKRMSGRWRRRERVCAVVVGTEIINMWLRLDELTTHRAVISKIEFWKLSRRLHFGDAYLTALLSALHFAICPTLEIQRRLSLIACDIRPSGDDLYVARLRWKNSVQNERRRALRAAIHATLCALENVE